MEPTIINLALLQGLAVAANLKVVQLNYTALTPDRHRSYTVELAVGPRHFALQLLEHVPHQGPRGYSAAFIEVDPASKMTTSLGASSLTNLDAVGDVIWDEANATDVERGRFTFKDKPITIHTDPLDCFIMALFHVVKHNFSGHPSQLDFYGHLRREARNWLRIYEEPLYKQG